MCWRKVRDVRMTGPWQISKRLRRNWRKDLSLRGQVGEWEVESKASDAAKEVRRGGRKAKEYIAAGDIFQVVLSQRAEFEPGVEPFQIYRALRQVNPSPYMYFLRMGDNRVLGSSPEMLVRVKGKKLDYRADCGHAVEGQGRS